MKIGELLREAAYDLLVDAVIRQFPEQREFVKGHVQWAKEALKNPDRIIWYLRILRAELEGKLGPDLLGNYRWRGIQQLGTDVAHFYGYNYAPIENYRFGKNTVSDVIGALTKFERDWKSKQDTDRGVEPQEGDYRLLEFGGGYAWWWVNRAYCDEEGRSGKHCGNVAGKNISDQHILSFRNAKNQVLLTFILEPDGTLGEMKAKSNQKPAAKYHPYIVPLLKLDIIKGIAKWNGQYAPGANFNMFDLNEDQLTYFLQTKPVLITSQLAVSPIDIIRAPESIRNNPELQKIAVSNRPGLEVLLRSEISNQTWEKAVKEDPELIIYAPHDIDNFEEMLLFYLRKDTGEKLLGSPASITRNVELLKKIIKVGDKTAIGGISPNTKGYSELCELAITKKGEALRYVPDNLKTEHMCMTAVTQNGSALEYVPEELKTEQMCMTAVTKNGTALRYVPDNLKTERMCMTVVTKNGYALQYVPEKLKTERVCMAAVTQNGYTLWYVPDNLKTERVCMVAVTQNGTALLYVPDNLKTERVCMAAVTQNGYALQYVPEKLKTERVCMAAVTQNVYAFLHVPEKLKHIVRQKLGL
jgi:IMP cyclohydrolase